jgi:uncharacterized protein (DUF2252 family)
MTAASHPSPIERREIGIAARAALPLAENAHWTPGPDRGDPVKLLLAQDAARDPALVPIRHGRMAASAFAFFRGSAAIMAADLGSLPNSGLVAQLCGDAHAVNFGLYASPERRLVFDVNDFDESMPGPFEWDVKRLAASIAVIAAANGFSDAQGEEAARSTAGAYRSAMRNYARANTLDVWYATLSADDLTSAAGQIADQVEHDDRSARRVRRSRKRRPGTKLSPKRADRLAAAAEHLVRKSIHQARTSTNLYELAKITEVVSGQRRFVSRPPVLVPLRELATTDPAAAHAMAQTVDHRLASYAASLPDDRQLLLSRFEVCDVARKVVGVGSAGMLDLVVMVTGRDRDDAVFLQVKQATQSALAPYLPAAGGVTNGERVVFGQRRMQAASDVFLGWSEVESGGESFYWRQLLDMKASPPVELMSPATLALHGRMCATTLAAAHGRSADPVAIAAYLGSRDGFDTAIGTFARRYARQNAADFKSFSHAVDDGSVPVIRGV